MARASGEQKIGGERLYDGRVVVLEVDRVRLPGGGETLREVVRHRGAAVVLAVRDDGRLLLVRQHRYPVAETLLELPAGTLEDGEDPLHCAARELAEETGCAPASLRRLGTFYSAPGYTDERLHAVLATGLVPAEATPDPDEIIEVEAHSVDAVLEMISSGGIRDAKTIATVMLARLKNVL